MGETVGEIGSADILGRTYIYAEARAQRAIPLGLAPGGTVVKDVAKGGMLTEENFRPDSTRFVYKLRQMQNAQLAMEAQV